MKEIKCKSLKNMILECIEDNIDTSEFYRTFPIIHLENGFIIYSQFNGNVIFHDNNYYCIIILEIHFDKEGEPKNSKVVLFKVFEYMY